MTAEKSNVDESHYKAAKSAFICGHVTLKVKTMLIKDMWLSNCQANSVCSTVLKRLNK